MTPDGTTIDKIGQLLASLMMFLLIVVDIVMVRSGAEPAPRKCEQFAHALSTVHIEFGWYNAADSAEKIENIRIGLDVLLCS